MVERLRFPRDHIVDKPTYTSHPHCLKRDWHRVLLIPNLPGSHTRSRRMRCSCSSWPATFRCSDARNRQKVSRHGKSDAFRIPVSTGSWARGSIGPGLEREVRLPAAFRYVGRTRCFSLYPRFFFGWVSTLRQLLFVQQSQVKRLLNGSRVIRCILEELPLIRHLQIQLVKHYGQSFLPLQVYPIQKRLLRFRNLV